ncbi:nickel/cobalt transporter [Micromonospora sp. KC721]|uniref:nickel/cobalt transporter n=1 Tax=Micromonospora sp. KC721 TaxID=2530380 RepID=UPI00104FB4A7|nr:hypothetical protein [Micromonospora sp. KC721]TDB82252.1 hypothetical protein E1182_02155 [Micromonospora sp. KC721]
MKRLGAILSLITVTALAGVLLPAGPAAAHPLDAYLQVAYLAPAPHTIGVELAIYPGVLVAPAALAALDPDADQQITDLEARAYGERILGFLELRADGQPLRAVLSTVDVPPYLTIQAGYGTIRLHAEARGAPSAAGTHEIFFRNDHAPEGAAYQVNATVGKDGPVVLGAQHRDATQQQSRITYRIDAAATSSSIAATGSPHTAEQTGRLLGILESPTLSLTVVLLAFGFAALLGALHAMTPGHAKTLMAAYLVGSGGTTRNALTLGAVITFTHTASVIGIGLVALFASRFLVPGILVPILETVSGALVLAIGLILIKQRWSSIRNRTHGHGHAGAGPHTHSHGGRPHTHALPAGGVTARGLVAMGVSGGLIPCPEALGVMVLAVGVNRTVLGLGLIFSFSLGLAAVLMGLGIMLVRSRRLIGRFEHIGNRWTHALPLVSAVVVTGLGIGLLLRAFDAGVPPLA